MNEFEKKHPRAGLGRFTHKPHAEADGELGNSPELNEEEIRAKRRQAYADKRTTTQALARLVTLPGGEPGRVFAEHPDEGYLQVEIPTEQGPVFLRIDTLEGKVDVVPRGESARKLKDYEQAKAIASQIEAVDAASDILEAMKQIRESERDLQDLGKKGPTLRELGETSDRAWNKAETTAQKLSVRMFGENGTRARGETVEITSPSSDAYGQIVATISFEQSGIPGLGRIWIYADANARPALYTNDETPEYQQYKAKLDNPVTQETIRELVQNLDDYNAATDNYLQAAEDQRDNLPHK